MKAKVISIAVCICTVPLFYSQEKEVKIDTVFIFDSQINRQKEFHPLQIISAESIQHNATNASEVLRFQTPMYIKENGRGASSSPSFRGTTAQQTAFFWNGIPINSVFLGQGDINNIGFLLADQLGVKSGGGSVLYGSAAIGGSVHLNNQLSFDKGFHTQWFSEVASYGLFQNILKSTFSNKKISLQISAQHNINQNDYRVEEQDYFNQNGQYSNGSANVSMAYKLNNHHQISWISEGYQGNQHFPIFTSTQNKSHYKTYNFKTLGIWDYQQNKIDNHFRLAFVEDEFQYYQKEGEEQSSGGTAKNFILKNDFLYQLRSNLQLNALAEFQQNNAEGYLSGITSVKRNAGSAAFLVRYRAFPNLQWEAGIKKETVQSIASPWLYSLSGKWTIIPQLSTALSFSKNFRYPSFNDLYFQPGGNLNLLPETSLQYEWKNQWKQDNFSISVTPYLMNIKDMIRWLPSSEGYWKAFNTNAVQSYGVETNVQYQNHWENHNLKAMVGYSFTKSINQESQMQLMYVPYHKAQGLLEYRYQKTKIWMQGMWNGKTYTDSMQKESEALKPYLLINVGAEWPWIKGVVLGAKMNNLTNQIYATTAYYYMPKRNFSLNMKINF